MRRITYEVIITCLLSVVFIQVNAQHLTGNAGKCIQSEKGSLSWSLGEPISFYIISENGCLTQGFQQPHIVVTAIKDHITIDYKIKVFPNPVHSNLTIRIEGYDFTHFSFKLFDGMGRIIRDENIQGSSTKLTVSQLVPSLYYLKVYKQGIEVKTFKVVKQ